MAPRVLDNTINTATELGVLDRVRRVTNSLNSVNDLSDYYKFSLTNRSRFTSSLVGLQDDANLILLNRAGRVLGVSRKDGRQAEGINRRLEAGQYYIGVSLRGRQTNYVLRLSAGAIPTVPPPPGGGTTPPPPGGGTTPPPPGGGSTLPPPPPPGGGTTIPNDPGAGQPPAQQLPPGITPITPTPDPGSVPGLAFDVGVLSTVKLYRNTVGGTDLDNNGVLERAELDPSDFYKFTVEGPTRVRILTGNVVGGSVKTSLIYDLNGNGAVDGNDLLASDGSIVRSLSRGTYFVGVEFAGGGNVSYDLSLEQFPITDLNYRPEPLDPFIGLGGAKGLRSVTGRADDLLPSGVLTSFRQIVGSTDSTDIYKFQLNAEANTFSMLLDTKQLSGDVTVSLIYDVDGNGIANPTRKFFRPTVGDDAFVETTYGDFIAGVVTTGGAAGSVLTLSETLGKGEYYIAVTQKGLTENTTYDLSLFTSAIALTPGTDPMSGLGGATLVTPLDTRNTANYDPVNYQQITQFVGASDGQDTYRFTLTETRNVVINYRGSQRPVALRLVSDWNKNGLIDVPEDGTASVLGQGGIPEQFGQRNGRLDFVDSNRNGLADLNEISEDRNGNGLLDRNEVLEPEPTVNTQVPYNLPPVEYSPLPPFPKPANDGFDFTEAFDDLANAYITTTPTMIYAKLAPGEYFLQVDAKDSTVETILGDGVQRLGPGNVLYSLSFFLEP